MRSSWKNEAAKLLKRKKQQRRWKKATAILAAAALCITTYAFIMPAAALEQETYCGEDHEHTEECYVEPDSAGEDNGDDKAADNTAVVRDTEESVSETEENLSADEDIQTYAAPLDGEILDEGSLSDTLYWKYTEDETGERTLTVYGTGPMPDYASYSEQPWQQYMNDIDNIVIEDGVTSVGAHAFHNVKPSHIELGSDVEIIKTYAFSYMSGTNLAVTVPGNVKTIESYAFAYGGGLHEITLEEGVESIGNNAFISSSLSELTLPASLKEIDGQLGYPPVSAYNVREGNPLFYAEDGVLFKRLEDGTSCLVAYPVNKEDTTYTIPENVSQLGSFSFRGVKNLQTLTIPSTVTEPLPSSTFTSSSLVDVVIEDGVTFAGNSYEMFAYCSSLRSIRLPDDVATSFDASFCQDVSLEEITVPKSITRISNNVFTNLRSLQKMTFNAENCTLIGTPFTAQGSNMPQDFELEIGNEVNILPGATSNNQGFASIAERASLIIFKGENDQIVISEGALDGAPVPLDGLSGTFYVDNQGILYQLREEDHTAVLVYCPPGNDSVQIPESVTSAGEEYRVTEVGQYAFIQASGLGSITFENPESIEVIAARAFANLSSLEIVNGKTTEEEAESSFTNAQVGYQAFYGTGLEGAGGDGNYEEEMDGVPDLEIHYVDDQGETSADAMYITVNSETAQWQEEGAEEGGYRLLTGDELNVMVSVGNVDATDYHGYRIYFELTGLDGHISLVPGVTYNLNGIEAECHATESPNIVYLDFLSRIGNTATFSVTANYPSPQSEGGGIKIWGEAYYAVEGQEQPENLEPEQYIQAYWTTEPDDFTLTKSSSGSSNISLTGDGEGNVILGSDLTYSIVLNRTEDEVSSYGKDYVKSVDYTDTPELPAGISWKEEVLEAVRNNDVSLVGNTIYAGDIPVASISAGSSKRVTCTEDGKLQFSWRIANTTGGAQMAEISTNNTGFTIMSEAVDVDIEAFDADQGETVNNTVDAQIHYCYSEDVQKTASAVKNISAGNARITFTKSAQDITYFGEDITYTLQMNNPGTYPYIGEDGVYTVEDTLDTNTYISAEGMQKMFDEEYGADLTVTITGAELAQWVPVTGTDGTQAWQNGANTDMESLQPDQTLTVRQTSDGQILVRIEGGEEYTGADVYEALKNAGYAPTASARYTVSWTLNAEGENFVCQAGESRRFQVYATAKDTFLMLTRDWPTNYINENDITYTNTAGVWSGSGGRIAYTSRNVTAHREAYLSKTVYKDGRELTEGPDAGDGDVLDYVLNFRHFGTGSYENLPMVDDLYGSQMLLVEADRNPELKEKNLEEYTDEEGTLYYILSEGEYTDVVVGSEEGEYYTAAFVTVTEGGGEVSTGEETNTYSGLHTQIKWYFPELKEDYSYQMSISYKAIVDISAAEGVSYDIGNVVWMNDRTDSRLYASLWGGGTIIDFDKEILLTGDDGTEEAVRYSAVSQGEKVRYRLTLRNTADADYTVSGGDMADILPNNYEVFQWDKSDIQVEWESTSDSTDISGLDAWYLSDTMPGAAESSGQQYLLWPEDTYIRFHDASEVYIYVTLTFPSNSGAAGEENALWDEYCTAVGGGVLSNTFTLYNFPANVTHQLRERGEALLQKGVYGTSYYTNSRYYESASRIYYNNKDMTDRQIIYYVVVYNSGNARLYLNDIYDRLPEGFTYTGMLDSARMLVTTSLYNPTNTVLTQTEQNEYSFVDAAVNDREDVVWKSAQIYAAEEEDGGLRFRVSAGSGTDSVRYDEERRMCYLDGGEAIVFGYMCDIGLSAETEDSAENVIGMAYEDYLGTGVESAEDNVSFTGIQNENHTDFNDGSCVVSTSAAAEEYGFPADEEHDTWLMSDVTVSRGGIRPGVTKNTESYEDSGGMLHEYETAVGPWDKVNWMVSYENDGTLSMVDYTLCDTLPAPYTVTGPVTYTVYDGDGMTLSTRQLFVVEDHAPDAETVTITRGTSIATSVITVNGEEEEVSLSGNSNNIIYVSFERDDAGNETLKIRMPSRYMAIPENGSAELELSARNMSGSYMNKVYTNRAMIYPVQEFDGTNQGTLLRDEEGSPAGVINSAPVNVASGYATQSEKKVEEVINPDNSAVSSDPSDNTIILGNAENVFRYTLSVTNSTDVSMSELVLFDTLPAENDHSPFDPDVPRGSEFQVDFAANPELVLQVKLENGEILTLDSDAYTAEYSTKTELDSQDRDGSAKTGWGAFSTDARSLRIIIADPDGITIPANAEVMLSFNAIVHRDESGEATSVPGEIAWNSFGYHYRLMGVDYSLEAMPLNVGVKVPTAPDVQKKLIDLDGNPYAPDEDVEFQIVIHEGEPLESYYEGAIAEAGRKITVVNLTVKAGETESEVRKMVGFNVWQWNTAEGRWERQEDLWQWKEGAVYTVIENWQNYMPEGYEFDHYEGQPGEIRTYRFVYQSGVQETITCINQYTQWKSELTKTDEGDGEKLLPGAIFGLYSPDQEDALTDEEFGELDVAAEREIEAEGSTWYLSSVETSDSDGKIIWDGLYRENYYLLELRAPDGYNLAAEGMILNRDAAVNNILPVTFTNASGFNIPETGGSGTIRYTAAGALLMTAALIYGYRKRRKEADI